MRATLDAREFQEAGYLAEVNRRVLHPLGLALAVTLDRPGLLRRLWRALRRPPAMTVGPIYDERDDPEGVVFGWAQMPPEYAALLAERFDNVNRLWKERERERNARLGFMVQPGTRP